MKATYRKNRATGRMEETQASIKRRIADLTGFMQGSITLLEGDATVFDTGGKRYVYYTGVLFEVKGKQFWAALSMGDWGTNDLRHA